MLVVVCLALIVAVRARVHPSVFLSREEYEAIVQQPSLTCAYSVMADGWETKNSVAFQMSHVVELLTDYADLEPSANKLYVCLAS